MYNFKTNSANAITGGAAICRIIVLQNIASLVSSLSCIFCNFMKHRPKGQFFYFDSCNKGSKLTIESSLTDTFAIKVHSRPAPLAVRVDVNGHHYMTPILRLRWLLNSKQQQIVFGVTLYLPHSQLGYILQLSCFNYVFMIKSV